MGSQGRSDRAGWDGQPTFVFVHGAHANAAAWSGVLRELAFLGHRALAVDLPGHGIDASFPMAYQSPQDLAAFSGQPSPLAHVTLEDNVAHVEAAVRRVAQYGPVVLAGTSGGGATISGVGNLVPDLVARIVYISAWCCVELPSVAAYLETLGHHGVAAAMVNWRTADSQTLAALKEGLLADGTDEQFRACLNTLEPADSAQVLTADCRVRASTWGQIPRSYVRFASDRAIPIDLQDQMIAEADALTPDNLFDTHTVDTSHMGVHLHPAEIASILDRLQLPNSN
ncbi:alpha/beta fold hydrolase [Nocardia sp. NPDC004151]|uniref:alpha/beta fold hydrolase n=1 Tax=Nocardia sp. NPDC004151 TaxID=3364304 RepID=UPI00369A564A